MKFLIAFVLLVASPAFACMGEMTEHAQEADASVLFEGKVTSYELGKMGAVTGITSGTLGKASFEVTKTLKGTNQKKWTAILRGDKLPKDFAAFKKQFGEKMKVGLRDFGPKIDSSKLPADYRDLFFVVDAACSMNGEDWLLRPLK